METKQTSPLYGCQDFTDEFLLEKRASNAGIESYLLLEEALDFIQDDSMRERIANHLFSIRKDLA